MTGNMQTMAEELAARAVRVIKDYGVYRVIAMSEAQREALLPPDIVSAVNALPHDQQQHFVHLVTMASRKMWREHGR